MNLQLKKKNLEKKEENKFYLSGYYLIQIIGFVILSIFTIINLIIPIGVIKLNFSFINDINDFYYKCNSDIIFIVLIFGFIGPYFHQKRHYYYSPKSIFVSNITRIILIIFIILNFWFFLSTVERGEFRIGSQSQKGGTELLTICYGILNWYFVQFIRLKTKYHE